MAECNMQSRLMILKTDVVSQKICEICRKVTIKMFEFRNLSIKADKYLKEQYAINLKKIEASKPCKIETAKPHSKTKKGKKSEIKKIKTVHKSVSDLFTTCPLVKIPTNLLSYDINPSVCMELYAVENYYKNNKLNMDKAVQLALKSLGPARNKTDASKNVEDKKDPISVVSFKKNSKRKTDKRETTTNTKKIKLSTLPTLMETLQLKPKQNVHLCEVCGSIQNSSETLYKHLGEHFRCNFCKAKFKLLELKNNHENICTVRHILSNEAYVYLNRIDLDLEAVQLYPVLNKSDDKVEDQPLDTSQSSDLFCTADIVLSEDDDSDKVNTVTGIAKDFQYSNTILIRPDIRIIEEDNIVLNYADLPMRDTEFLKQLLTRNSLAHVKISIEAGTQIDFPIDSKDIVKHHKAIAARFKALKPYLFVFKIPVHIRKGEFSVSYTKTIPNGTVTNKGLWYDLKPIGLKKTSIQSNTVTSKTIIPSTDINQKKSSTALVTISNESSRLEVQSLNHSMVVPNSIDVSTITIVDSNKDLSLQNKETPNGDILIESTTQTTNPSAGINQHKSSTDLAVHKQQKIVGNKLSPLKLQSLVVPNGNNFSINQNDLCVVESKPTNSVETGTDSTDSFLM